MTWTAALVSIGCVVLGVVLGWGLSVASANRARTDERDYQRRERVREQQKAEALGMDQALIETGQRLPVLGGPPALEAFMHAYRAWQDGWQRSTLLENERDLLDRYAAVGTILLMSMSDARGGRSGQQYVLSRAIENCRRAIAAYRREQPLPTPSFPASHLLGQLAPVSQSPDGTAGHDYGQLNIWLNRHPAADT